MYGLPWQDMVNGIFEVLGAPFLFLSIINLYKCKKVRGVSWLHAAFFNSWGFWNLYYYPHLNQWVSFVGGLLLVMTNTVWFVMMLYYILKEKRELRGAI